jgi:purine-binding chemotaxis protein CheW
MPEISGRSRQFVSFNVNGRSFGIDIRLIKEVTSSVRITPIPLKTRDVCGVVNIRGQVVLVLDISVSLGGQELVVTGDSQILILKTTSELESISDFHPSSGIETIGAIPVGFLVDSVGELVAVEAGTIEEAPTHLLAEYRQFVEGVVRQEINPMVILNAGAILAAGR